MIEDKPDIRRGFKLTFENRTSSHTGGPDAVMYNSKHMVGPRWKCGPLCVFEHLEDARKYVQTQMWWSSLDRYRLWLCIYRPSKEKKIWTSNGRTMPLVKLPEDTVLADCVRLVQEVEVA